MSWSRTATSANDNFRDFVFTNAVTLWGTQNPDFFKGTRVEKEAAAVLQAASQPALRRRGEVGPASKRPSSCHCGGGVLRVAARTPQWATNTRHRRRREIRRTREISSPAPGLGRIDPSYKGLRDFP